MRIDETCRYRIDVAVGVWYVGLDSDGKLRFEIGVYFTRLVFELIACEHIKAVMDYLTPAAGVTPVHSRPEHPTCFISNASTSAESNPDFAFTLT